MAWDDFLGEHLAMDVANTIHRHGWTAHDTLATPDDLRSFLAWEGDRLPATAVTPAGHAAFVALRDRVGRLLHAALAGEPLPADDVAAVDALVAAHPTVTRLADGATVTLGDGMDAVLARVAAEAVALLTGPDRDRLAFCDAPGCGGFFTRRRANQAWCGPDCGNRARVARHEGRARPA